MDGHARQAIEEDRMGRLALRRSRCCCCCCCCCRRCLWGDRGKVLESSQRGEVSQGVLYGWCLHRRVAASASGRVRCSPEAWSASALHATQQVQSRAAFSRSSRRLDRSNCSSSLCLARLGRPVPPSKLGVTLAEGEVWATAPSWAGDRDCRTDAPSSWEERRAPAIRVATKKEM